MESKDLGTLFSEVVTNWRLLEEDKKIDESSVLTCIEIYDRVQSLNLFSSNEEIEEVTTTSLKFMLIKYFEALFRIKPHEKDPKMDSWKQIMGCFLSFLKLLNDYGLKTPVNERQDPRSAKIERYKKEKRLKDQISKFEKEYPEGSAEEEFERKYWLDFIELAESNSNEQISLLKRELDMIKLRERGVVPQPPPKPAVTNSKPLIITKDQKMKEVFGLGYPSAPIYTVEEFGEKQFEIMKQQEREKAKYQAENPPPDPYRELTETEENEERRKNQRWDEYRDVTRRGDGNRKNMG